MSDTEVPSVAAATAGASPTKFLVELATTWTLLRLYGTEHPAFGRGAEAAAKAIDRPARVSINPRGFTPSPPEAPPELQMLAQRLRAMGLVGLTIEPGLTVEQVHALVLVLEEADRNRGGGSSRTDAIVDKIASATGGHIRAVPLRLEGLRLVEGTSDSPEENNAAESDIWREMFAGAFVSGNGGEGGGAGDVAAAAELARVFEASLGGAGTGAGGSPESKKQWNAMVGVWMKQLRSIDPAQLGRAANDAKSISARDATAANTATTSIDSVATFLSTLSPVLCQQLLKETVTGAAVPERVVLALSERLPAGVVIGALAAVDRSNAAPSTAALALLRKMSASAPAGGATAAAAAGLADDANPTTRAELAEIAMTLERLLRTDREQQFVPEEYLQRRTELSTSPVAAPDGLTMTCPDEAATAGHAAALAFDILATPDAAVADLTAALLFITDRVGGWIRAGHFALTREALSLAGGLVGHADPAVAKPSRALVSASIQAPDLLEGAAHRTDRAVAATELADLLRHADGKTLATLLSSLKPAPAGNAILDAVRVVLPELGDGTLEELFRAIAGTPPPALLAAITGLPQLEAIKMVQAIAPHASGPVRRAAVHVIFRRDSRWPMPLIDQLLRDDEAEIRRLAVMKLVSDTDLATAANILGAASKPGTYDVDVVLGLAELLRRHRHHADVRPGWRQWMWSRRWWSSLLFLNMSKSRRAA